MSRIVWPYLFTLRAGSLSLASRNVDVAAIRDKYMATTDGLSVVGLRWSSTPVLGFPREPFQVYRRKRNTLEGISYVTVLSTSTTLTGQPQTFPVFPQGDAAYVVIARVALTSAQSVSLQAIDVNGLPIPDQLITLSQSGFAEFRCPGITALTVYGTGTLMSIVAIGENAYANLPDWTQIQTVGLPLLNNEIGTSYTTNPQGFWPNPLTAPTENGVEAADIRTVVTALVEPPLPATGIADFPLPDWPKPNGTAYVANIRTADSLVPMIERCLENSVDTDPTKMQSEYSETITTDGLSQIGAALPSPSGSPSQVVLPITGVVMLAVSTDPYAAVALGYGTLDIPPTSLPSVSVAIAPFTATVVVDGTQQFTATVTGATSNAVVWAVNGIPGGNATLGTISTTGLYTAPASVPASNPVNISATSAQYPIESGYAQVTVVSFIIQIPVPTKPVSPPVAAQPAVTAAKTSAATPAPAATSPAQPTPTTPQPFIAVPPTTYAPVDNYGSFDYMVTAPFVFPFGINFTLAALSSGQLPVVAPAGLDSALTQVHAPLQRDQAAPAVVRINWNASPAPQGYAVLASRAANQSQVLNVARPATVGGYDTFVGLTPLNPDPNLPPDQQGPSFSDVDCSLPLAAPAVDNRYLVAAQDIFGQWSSWVETDTSIGPAPVTKPGLISAEFLYSASSPPSPVVSASLRIDFTWNWQDRAPGQIRFTGQFVPAPAITLDPAYLSGFATNSTGPIGAPVILTFSYSGFDPDTVGPTQIIPTITSGQTSNGPVEILATGSPPSTGPNPDIVQYRIELTGIQLDFSAANELDFLLYATATEEVQPGVWSDPTDQSTSNVPASPPAPPLFVGKIVRAIDPNPPVITFNPPPITWTALPDATGTARGVLQWQPDPSAVGYFVWEATESALLHFLPPGTGTPEPTPNTPYETRATALQNLLNANQDYSLQGFGRLTQDPIPGSSTEITLPGSAEILYVYRISAIGANNVESARSSSVAFVAVPHRNVPGTPRIMLRSVPGSPGGLQVIVLPVESSAAPAGYRLFRVRNQALSENASTMGPPKYNETSPAWQDYTSTTLAGNPLNGKSLLDTAAISSWYPYYYRATAIGAQDLTNGVYSGESAHSSVQTGYVLPSQPPLITSFNVTTVGPFKTAALITLTTDLPAADLSPVGPALIELIQLVHQSAGSPPLSHGSPSPEPGSPSLGPLVQHQLAAVAPNLISVGMITPPPLPPPVASARFARSEPDANGHWELYMLIPYSTTEAGTFILRLTDPLARQSTVSF